MKKEPWLSSALIVSGTLHLLFLTQLLQTHQNALIQAVLADAILLVLGMPALAANVLAYVYQNAMLALFSALAYGLTVFVPMEGFELFLVPAAMCLFGWVRMMRSEEEPSQTK